VLAVFFGAILGDSTGYLIGRFGGQKLLLRFGPLVGLTPERFEMAQALFHAKGAYVIVVARFVVVLRQLNGVMAGSLAMPWPRFVAANIVGAALWTAVWTLGPYFLTDLFVPPR
jgi:membrane protein DedA with SNARE-associated domain